LPISNQQLKLISRLKYEYVVRSMSRRRRRSIFDIFDDLHDFFREIEEEFRELFGEAERIREVRSHEESFREIRGPFIYGFRVTIGPDGRPKVEEFGNIRRSGIRPKISEEIEPLVDVLDEGDKIRVIAEMPGVEKDKISLKAVDRKLIIRASNHKRYYKEVELPDEVDIQKARASYRNGVLEVVLEKKSKERKEFEIKVE